MIFIVFCIILSLFTLYLCKYSIKLYYKRNSFAHIPGPRSDTFYSFYTGNLGEILDFIHTGKNFHDYILKWYIIELEKSKYLR